MKTLSHCICEYIPHVKNHKQTLKIRSNIINKLKREHPKGKIFYDGNFVICEYQEGRENN